VPQLGNAAFPVNNTYTGNQIINGNATVNGTFTQNGALAINNFAGANNGFAGNITAQGTINSNAALPANNTFVGNIVTVAGNISGFNFTSTGVGANNVFAGPVIAPGFGAPNGAAANFVGNNATQVVSVTQNGTGDGLDASSAGGVALRGNGTPSAPAVTTIGVEGTSTSRFGAGVIGLTGSPLPSTLFGSYGIQGISSAAQGFGVLGSATDTTPNGGFAFDVGVQGQVANSNGSGVFGEALATSGSPAGVTGDTMSPTGTGVFGRNQTGSANAPPSPQPGQFGVQGVAVGNNGVGVFGHSVDHSGTGTTIGVQGIAEANQSIPLGSANVGTGVQGVGGLGGVIGLSPVAGITAIQTSLLSLSVATPEVSLNPGVVGIGSTGVIGLADGATIDMTPSGVLASPGVFGKGSVGVAAEATFGSTNAALLLINTSASGGMLLDTYGTLLGGGNGRVFSVGSTGAVSTNDFMQVGGALTVTGNAIVNGGTLQVTGSALVIGNATVTGMMSAGSFSSNSKAFKIDHPLAPERKYLYHSSVESPDMKDIYDGVVTLDSRGRAWVILPDWFQALNNDFRYQLTAIGAPAPNLYIAQEVRGNRFKIAGGKPGGKVSWQVTGIRQDAYAKKHRIQVEEEKPAAEQGYYLSPDSYGQPEEKGVAWARSHPAKQKSHKQKVQWKRRSGKWLHKRGSKNAALERR